MGPFDSEKRDLSAGANLNRSLGKEFRDIGLTLGRFPTLE
jgi:hypothetical protein